MLVSGQLFHNIRLNVLPSNELSDSPLSILLLRQIKIIYTEKNYPQNILCLKIYLASIGRGINEMWDAIDNIWANPLKQKSQQIFINNQHIINIIV